MDPDDPYFFDHPLDHVPGMALVCGLLELVRFTGTPVEGVEERIRTTLSFPLFCELDAPVRLTATGSAAAPAGLTVRAEQAGTIVCAGTIEYADADRPTAEAPAGRRLPAGVAPADPALVHRRHPGNVLVSEVCPADAGPTVAVRRPPPGHPLTGGVDAPVGGPARVELVIDAARQFATMLNHVAHRAKPDVQFVLLEVDADLPGTLPGELELGWTPTAATRGQSTLVTEVLVDGVRRGHVGFRYFAAAPAVYQRLRRPTRTVATIGGQS